MAKQLSLRLTRQKGIPAFDAGCAINWRSVSRRARRIAAMIAAHHLDVTRNGGLRDGFAIRAYADDAALLENIRALRHGKQLRKRVRKAGDRLRIPRSVLMAATPEGRRLHAAETQLEERVTAREAATLCG